MSHLPQTLEGIHLIPKKGIWYFVREWRDGDGKQHVSEEVIYSMTISGATQFDGGIASISESGTIIIENEP